jgi:hypothetical protein
MVALLPPYLFHLLFVNIQLFANESLRDQQAQQEDGSAIDEDALQSSTSFSNAVVMICGLVNILNSVVFCMQTKSLGIEACTRIWSIVDFSIIITNFITLLNLVFPFGIQNIRVIESVLILCMWFKSLYYMRLVTEIAPLVESIFVIMSEMLYFLLIFFIGIISFSEAFFILGKNQVMLTKGMENEEEPSYANIVGAF